MQAKRINKVLTILTLSGSILAGGTLGAAPQAQAAEGFADPAFGAVWARTDQLVQSGQVQRSWYWGPQPNTGAMQEDYAEGPGGKHLVQYFDKTRMEINNPNADKTNPFFVTNGLLTRELISGNMQTGDNKFVLRWPAYIPIAGDTNTTYMAAVTYASFRGAIERKDADATGKVNFNMIYPSGELDFEHGAKSYMDFERYNVKNTYYEKYTGHNIPEPFWQFLNLSGPIMVNGKQQVGQLSNPYFYATGLPISDAYWTTVNIGAQKSVAVLIQAYERRTLTYVPTNPNGFKVQMGNVGQHYYDWRYRDAGKPPALAGTCPAGYPALGFGQVYNANLDVKLKLGCQNEAETRATVVHQAFEHGSMIGVIKHDFYAGRDYEDVYVLYDDGTVATTNYAQILPEPVPAPLPSPNGLHTPVGTFGVIWGANQVRDRLGFATEFARTESIDQDQKGGAPIQYFLGGFMVYPDLAAKKIYVLYNTSGSATRSPGPHNSYIIADRWLAFDDTYTP